MHSILLQLSLNPQDSNFYLHRSHQKEEGKHINSTQNCWVGYNWSNVQEWVEYTHSTFEDRKNRNKRFPHPVGLSRFHPPFRLWRNEILDCLSRTLAVRELLIFHFTSLAKSIKVNQLVGIFTTTCFTHLHYTLDEEYTLVGIFTTTSFIHMHYILSEEL